MAITKEKKREIVSEFERLFEEAKLTVAASYTGLGVKELQVLRREARTSGTTVRVTKNRLVVRALQGIDRLKDTDVSVLKGQLVYVFNGEDEVIPAKVVADFAKTHPQLAFVGAVSRDGVFLSAEDVRALAALPSKDQLRGQLVGTIAAPLSGFVNVLAGNVRGVLNVLQARADTL